MLRACRQSQQQIPAGYRVDGARDAHGQQAGGSRGKARGSCRRPRRLQGVAPVGGQRFEDEERAGKCNAVVLRPALCLGAGKFPGP